MNSWNGNCPFQLKKHLSERGSLTEVQLHGGRTSVTKEYYFRRLYVVFTLSTQSSTINIPLGNLLAEMIHILLDQQRDVVAIFLARHGLHYRGQSPSISRSVHISSQLPQNFNVRGSVSNLQRWACATFF